VRRPSTTHFGVELATRVTALLEAGGYVLRGSSSHWLVKFAGEFRYEVLKNSRRVVFATKDAEAFSAWLAQQSARSLDDVVRAESTDTIDVITDEVLEDAVTSNAGVLDPKPYGASLAGRVASALDGGGELLYNHRDYCGMGLVKTTPGYAYCVVSDGQPDPRQSFPTRDAFVTWLAAQSDFTLSGRESADPFDWDNQRVTRARLLALR
jgi:hypothetical protein